MRVIYGDRNFKGRTYSLTSRKVHGQHKTKHEIENNNLPCLLVIPEMYRSTMLDQSSCHQYVCKDAELGNK